MTDVEKAYLAGIIDGEGSIMLQRIHKIYYSYVLRRNDAINLIEEIYPYKINTNFYLI